MDTYLLLRSNKQSGPYSLQQLVNVGLKPYDLVWVQGKSAAWRYPSEVEPLKAYAPATEEQPFDRFYKKPEEKPQEKPVDHPQEEKIVSPPPAMTAKEEVYATAEEPKTATASKKVFVSMPGGNNVPRRATQPVMSKPPVMEEKPRIIEEKRIETKPVYPREEVKKPIHEERVALPTPEPVFKAPTISTKEVLPTLEEKYSESLDDIKKRYTETYLTRKQRSKWTSTHTSILQVFGGAIFFCFLVVVAYKNFAGEEKSQQKTTVIQPDKRAINTSTVSTTPVTTAKVANEKEKPAQKSQTPKQKSTPKDENLAVGTIEQQLEEIKSENDVAVIEEKPAEKKAVMPKVEDELQIEEPVKPKTRPVNINRLVKVRANEYKQRAFGGVMNLELTVNNNSKFELDRVIVELQYLKPSEQPIKTERVVFNSIGANDSKTLKIPDYLRGVKISYRVTDIESSQYERQTAGL